MPELTQRQIENIKDAIRRSDTGIKVSTAYAQSLIDAAETLLALDWITELYCGDCPRENECENEGERAECVLWAVGHRSDLLGYYRKREQ